MTPWWRHILVTIDHLHEKNGNLLSNYIPSWQYSWLWRHVLLTSNVKWECCEVVTCWLLWLLRLLINVILQPTNDFWIMSFQNDHNKPYYWNANDVRTIPCFWGHFCVIKLLRTQWRQSDQPFKPDLYSIDP